MCLQTQGHDDSDCDDTCEPPRRAETGMARPPCARRIVGRRSMHGHHGGDAILGSAILGLSPPRLIPSRCCPRLTPILSLHQGPFSAVSSQASPPGRPSLTRLGLWVCTGRIRWPPHSQRDDTLHRLRQPTPGPGPTTASKTSHLPAKEEHLVRIRFMPGEGEASCCRLRDVSPTAAFLLVGSGSDASAARIPPGRHGAVPHGRAEGCVEDKVWEVGRYFRRNGGHHFATAGIAWGALVFACHLTQNWPESR